MQPPVEDQGRQNEIVFLQLPLFQSLDTDSPPLTRFFKTVKKQPKAGIFGLLQPDRFCREDSS